MHAPTIMPASFSTATRLPDDAMCPRRDAEPLSCVAMEEKVSDCCVPRRQLLRQGGRGTGGDTYGRPDDGVVVGVAVDVNRHAAQRRHL